MTVRFLPSNRTRLPCELGCRRPASSTTPALTRSSLNFWYSAIASGVGAVAASLCSPSLAIISTRILVSSYYSFRIVMGSALWASPTYRMTDGRFDMRSHPEVGSNRRGPAGYRVRHRLRLADRALPGPPRQCAEVDFA